MIFIEIKKIVVGRLLFKLHPHMVLVRECCSKVVENTEGSFKVFQCIRIF